MTEDGKRAAGLLFFPGDPALKAIKLRTHKLNIDYNNTYEDETEKRAEILGEMLGELGEGSFLQGPVTFHYGQHTKIGKGVFINFNLTVQDVAEVVIDDGCDFGPNVTIVTPVHPMLADERKRMRNERGEEKRLCYAKPARRKKLLDLREHNDPAGRDNRGQLRDRRGKRCDPRHPRKQLCGGESRKGDPHADRSRQHGASARTVGRKLGDPINQKRGDRSDSILSF